MQPATQELTFEVPAQPLHLFDCGDENWADHGRAKRIAGGEGWFDGR